MEIGQHSPPHQHQKDGNAGIITHVGWVQSTAHAHAHAKWGFLNDNDNDNDTLREVPHPSNEGLALQARVSGP